MNVMLSEVRSRFLTEAHIKLLEVSAASQVQLAKITERPRDNPLFLYAHRVSGVAPTLGFEDLGARARDLEDQLEKFFGDPRPEAFPNNALDDFLEELAFAVSAR